jgi:hypothetical protein
MVPPRKSVAERRELVVMRIVLIFLLLCSPALAHDASRPELNEWFNKLASGRGLCCSFADGFAVSDVDWESKGGCAGLPSAKSSLPSGWAFVSPRALH